MNKNINKSLIYDWIELYILLQGSVSRDDILWEFDYLDEKDVDDVFFILSKRLIIYWFEPYHVWQWIISTSKDLSEEHRNLYLFILILSVYWNKFQSNEAWKLFERLSNEVFAYYFWWKSIVFGFPDWISAGLIQKIDDLAQQINERRWNQNPLPSAKDDKLDIVTIKEIDSRHNKLIILSQCAAGYDWNSKLTQLSVYKWQQYINFWVQPLRWFSCVAFIDDERIFYDRWLEWGIVFDRARIIRFLMRLTSLQDTELLVDIKDWIVRATWEYNLNVE